MRISRFGAIVGDSQPPWPAWVPTGTRRRLDALNRLACATVDSILPEGPLPAQSAVVVANSYGSVDSTLRFISTIANFGDQSASPTAFTTSVHNSSAGVLGELLSLHGPSTTISQGGTGGLTVLRWAMMLLTTKRAPAVLVVVRDRHVPWSKNVVGKLSDCPWPIGDGAAALLIEEGAGAGRELRIGRHPAQRCLDGGALLEQDERLLERLSEGQHRQRAPDSLGSWWPCCLLSALPWTIDEALQLREVENGHLLEAWVGPYRER